jgi:hypothetical protein
LNLSGFNGTTVTKHLPIRDIRVEIPLKASAVKALCGGSVRLEPTARGCTVCLNTLERFEAIVID